MATVAGGAHGSIPPNPPKAQKLIGLAAAAALLVGVLAACAPPPPEPLAPTTTSTDLPVGHVFRAFTDSTRVIPGYDWVFGGRPVPTDIWYPTDRAVQAPYPLVLFAHGYGVGPMSYAPLLERIASAGYVVAAPTYPVLSGWPYGPSDVDDWDQKFPDTTFVTDSMLGIPWFDTPLGGMIDGSRIAIVGHSDLGAIRAWGRLRRRARGRAGPRGEAGAFREPRRSGVPAPTDALLHVVPELDAYNPFGPTMPSTGTPTSSIRDGPSRCGAPTTTARSSIRAIRNGSSSRRRPSTSSTRS